MCPINGLTKESASLRVAAVQFVYGLGTFISALHACYVFHLKDASPPAFFGLVSASLMNMYLALVLFFGLNSNRPFLIHLWLAWSVLILIVFVVVVPFMALYAYAISIQLTVSNFALIYITFVFSFFLHCFFVYIVYGYYEESTLARMERKGELFKDYSDQLQQQKIGYKSPLMRRCFSPIYTIKTREISTTHEI